MDEFGFIHTLLKPLAESFEGSLNLTDDAALLHPPEGCDLVVTKDAMVEGVHFFGYDDPALIARKLLRVNLSDLAAMGATPYVYFLALMLPPASCKDSWLQRFTQGLAQDQQAYTITLAGGDTTSTSGFLCLSLTALGTVPSGQSLKRNGAQPGDTIYVSGTLGDSALGLHLLQHTEMEQDPFLLDRYYLPQPRLALGERLRDVAHAVMDISDGLMQDLGHLCKASGVGAIIEKESLPFSAHATSLISMNDVFWEKAITGGDDYELLFTASPKKTDAIATLSLKLNLPLTAIGHITRDTSCVMRDKNGEPVILSIPGFRHF